MFGGEGVVLLDDEGADGDGGKVGKGKGFGKRAGR